MSMRYKVVQRIGQVSGWACGLDGNYGTLAYAQIPRM